jgi:hypothetical protein
LKVKTGFLSSRKYKIFREGKAKIPKINIGITVQITSIVTPTESEEIWLL